ncbi:MAG: glutathione peroxidase [Oxalicibacterium faecigallinarum]|uniref:glutathione peroxidase n=1 Tax=Oxalicibacterium faecigallinarum TaxID=573741 RepID=UPI002809F768|nr:glutathione peroxidase [Oxalicibacterium faecigallinarum]MDQ7970653.1 glutathione peroxidase [Oxalicibacterium faecigallinarum]
MSKLYDFTVTALTGAPIPLAQYRGKVLLIVNTASECGFTPQYRQLQELQEQFQDRGFSVLGFPCNQFGRQEPGDADAIGSFCERNYGVTFPLFAKIDVNGNDADPLFKYLKHAAPGLLGSEGIKWNFTKFLVDTEGNVVKRYAPQTKPVELTQDIASLLPA